MSGGSHGHKALGTYTDRHANFVGLPRHPDPHLLRARGRRARPPGRVLRARLGVRGEGPLHAGEARRRESGQAST